jgi:hypothetical protein
MIDGRTMQRGSLDLAERIGPGDRSAFDRVYREEHLAVERHLVPLDALHRLALSLLVPPGLLIAQGGPPGFGGSTTPSVWMVVYAVGYVAVLVWAACGVFARRDL